MDNNKKAVIVVEGKSYEVETNPSRSIVFRKDATPEEMIEYCGFIPQFATAGGETFRENLDNNYVYGTNWSNKATISEDLTYHYPEDEPLAPIVTIRDAESNDQVVMYPYGLTAVRDGDGWLTSRLD